MTALKERLPKHHSFGIVGDAMRHAGVEGVADIDAFSVMGVSDVLRKAGDLRLLESQVLSLIDRRQPSFAVLIDNPGFNLRLAEQLKLRGIKVYQYVAPKIWAWGASRAPRIKASYDLVLGILPFEQAFYESKGIPYAYVGSPLMDRVDKVMVSRASLGLAAEQKIIACLPGSRPSELRLNLPTLVDVRSALESRCPGAIFLVPVASNLDLEAVAATLGSELRECAIPGLAAPSWEAQGLTFVRGMSLEVMAIADVAIVASGTATLECALLGTPLVVVYTMSALSYQIALRAVKLPYVSLVNLMAGRRLVAEFIQEFSPDEVAHEVAALLASTAKRAAMRAEFEDMRDSLGGHAAEQAAAILAAAHGSEIRTPTTTLATPNSPSRAH